MGGNRPPNIRRTDAAPVAGGAMPREFDAPSPRYVGRARPNSPEKTVDSPLPPSTPPTFPSAIRESSCLSAAECVTLARASSFCASSCASCSKSVMSCGMAGGGGGPAGSRPRRAEGLRPRWDDGQTYS